MSDLGGGGIVYGALLSIERSVHDTRYLLSDLGGGVVYGALLSIERSDQCMTSVIFRVTLAVG